MAKQRAAKSGKNTPWTPDKVRERIKTSVIADRLSKHVLGQIEMSPTQVRAAEILLRKTVPDLSATELTGELKVNHDITDEAMTPDEWEAQYGDGVGAATGPAEVTH